MIGGECKGTREGGTVVDADDQQQAMSISDKQPDDYICKTLSFTSLYIDICAGYRYRLSECVAVCVCVGGGGCSRCDNLPAIVSYIKSRLRCVAETETRACLVESVCGGCCQSLFRFTCRSAAMSHRQRIKRCDSNPRCFFPHPPQAASLLNALCNNAKPTREQQQSRLSSLSDFLLMKVSARQTHPNQAYFPSPPLSPPCSYLTLNQHALCLAFLLLFCFLPLLAVKMLSILANKL